MRWWNIFWLWYHNEMRQHHFDKRDVHLSRLRKNGKTRNEERDYETMKRLAKKIFFL